jgi:hypothetical protein
VTHLGFPYNLAQGFDLDGSKLFMYTGSNDKTSTLNEALSRNLPEELARYVTGHGTKFQGAIREKHHFRLFFPKGGNRTMDKNEFERDLNTRYEGITVLHSTVG